ncbi:putative DsbA family dithiol-disulfide isomerase [Planomicrobium soli]|uniref:Putative DsbA family dithiol-disulfide isomerase n=1 Tax=Planomicrobium soli TaxID=1176648 RepID=A0A2P8G487_9BACL|nr:DsbA family oxidoreductase [Planomicrobium soli]PSL28790.1 putative DsbA family dithiol-disulfide isomerase [Planomicrobium soli]
MKIEIWSDYACPFCYIGKRTFEQALKKSGFESKAEISFKAFQLDPAAPNDSAISVYDYLAKKMDQTVEQAKAMTQGVAEHAQSVGLQFNFEDMVHTNTFTAHRLAKWAESLGKDAEVTENLLRGYFIESKNVGDKNVLADIAEKAGLPREEAQAVIASERFTEEVLNDIEEARQIGIQGVPFFVVNRKYALSGAQPLETFVEAIIEIAEEEGIRPAAKPQSRKTTYCTGDSCEV